MLSDYQRCRLALHPLGIILPEVSRHLGAGCFGSAYATDCGRVMKMTSDAREASAALLVMANPQPHLVRVDHVMALVDWKGLNRWVLVVERLEPLSDEMRHHWDAPTLDEAILQYGPVHVDLSRGRADSCSPWWVAQVEAQDGVAAKVNDAVRAITVSLFAAGITRCTDAHSANVMVRPGTGEIVLCDLGCSQSSEDRTGTAPTIETAESYELTDGPQEIRGPVLGELGEWTSWLAAPELWGAL